MQQRMPNFIVIGAGKAGTKSIYEYLKQHPQIYMSKIKETKFFCCHGYSHDECLVGRNIPLNISVRDIDEYYSLFDGVKNETAIGEVSPQYLTWPCAASNIKNAIPDCKIIVILRDPVSRAFSSYKYRAAHGTEELDFRQSIIDDLSGNREKWRSGRIFEQGLYGKNLKRYFDNFDKSKIFICLYEDLVKNTENLLRKIFSFICVREDFQPILTKYNVSPETVRMNRISNFGKKLFLDWKFQKLEGNIPKKIRYRLFYKNVSVRGMSEEEKRWLRNLYQEDILECEKLTGIDLSLWKNG